MSSLSSAEVRDLIAERQRAIGTYRDSDEPDTQRRAFDAGEAIRTRLDDHLAAITEERELADMAEARDRAAGLAYSTTAASRDDGELRKLTAPMDPNGVGKYTAVFPIEKTEQRVVYPLLTTDTNTHSSYLSPTRVWPDVARGIIAASGVLKANPTIIRTPDAGPLEIPTIANDFTSTLRTEGSAATGMPTGDTFGKVSLNSYQVSGYTQASQEMIMSAAADMHALIVDMCARSLAKQIASELAIGVNTTTANGLFVGVTSGKTAASATTFTFDELLDLKASVPSQYWPTSSFVISDEAWLACAKAKTGEGSFLWEPSTQLGSPDTLLGHPCYIESNAPACTAGLKPIVFGDVTAGYVVRYCGGLEIAYSDDYAYTSFLRTYRWTLRYDGEVRISEAVRLLTMGT